MYNLTDYEEKLLLTRMSLNLYQNQTYIYYQTFRMIQILKKKLLSIDSQNVFRNNKLISIKQLF